MSNHKKAASEKKILIVDDIEYSRQLLRNSILSIYRQKPVLTTQFAISNANNGRSALNGIKQHRPDIVFLDIELPDIDGIELLKQIKKRYPEIFIVMVSGHSTISNVKAALSNGAAGFIVKPFSADKVFEVLHKFEKKMKS